MSMLSIGRFAHKYAVYNSPGSVPLAGTVKAESFIYHPPKALQCFTGHHAKCASASCGCLCHTCPPLDPEL